MLIHNHDYFYTYFIIHCCSSKSKRKPTYITGKKRRRRSGFSVASFTYSFYPAQLLPIHHLNSTETEGKVDVGMDGQNNVRFESVVYEEVDKRRSANVYDLVYYMTNE